MKLEITIDGAVIVAEGSGLALTIFLGGDETEAAMVSLVSCEVTSEGDRVFKKWLDNVKLRMEGKCAVRLVRDIETTPPSITWTESLAERVKAERDYCQKTLSQVNPPANPKGCDSHAS